MAFTGAMPSDKPAMPQSLLMIGAFPQSNGQIIAEFRMSGIMGNPVPGTSFTYEGRRFITTEVTQDQSRRECIMKAIHYPGINTDIYPDYEDIEVKDQRGATVSVVRQRKSAFFYPNLGTPWKEEQTASEARLLEAQFKQQQFLEQRELAKRIRDMNAAEQEPKPAVKPKQDPFPTAKRIIKLRD